jgi:D-3-phosphoglycerate dehydrogenase
MIKILANDGLEKEGIEKLSAAGMQADTAKIPQEQLRDKLNNYSAVVVRSHAHHQPRD